MSKFDREIWNERLACIAGYSYMENNIIVDGDGCQKKVAIISKNNIVVESYQEDGIFYKYLGRVSPSEPCEWDDSKLDLWDGTIRWESENIGKFMYLDSWKPNEDWNQLIMVANFLDMDNISIKSIEKAYDLVCLYILINH